MQTTQQAPTDEGLASGLSDEARGELEGELDLAFTPIHKRCLGVAVGVATALLIFAVTMLHLQRAPDEPYPLVLLSEYFIGYTVSIQGAFIGLAWGFWVGFVIGWFFAFARNFVMGATALFFRTRAEMADNRGFLDHI